MKEFDYTGGVGNTPDRHKISKAWCIGLWGAVGKSITEASPPALSRREGAAPLTPTGGVITLGGAQEIVNCKL